MGRVVGVLKGGLKGGFYVRFNPPLNTAKTRRLTHSSRCATDRKHTIQYSQNPPRNNEAEAHNFILDQRLADSQLLPPRMRMCRVEDTPADVGRQWTLACSWLHTGHRSAKVSAHLCSPGVELEEALALLLL